MPVSVLSKWGNSLALRVPKEVSSQFKEGDHFEVSSDESGLHFNKARKIKKYHINNVVGQNFLDEEILGRLCAIITG